MPFNDTLLPALQDKIRQAIAPKSPRLAALLLDNNCAVLKTKFNNVDTPENLNSAFAEQINNPLTQNLNDANLKTYLQNLGFADAANTADNRTVILAQMQAAKIPAAMATLVQQATEYVTTLETQKRSLEKTLAQNERDAANPTADEVAAIEAAKRVSRQKIASIEPLLVNARRFKEELERQNAAIGQLLTDIRADNVNPANATDILRNRFPKVTELNRQVTQLKQGSETAITEANTEIVKISKRPEANLDTYLTNLIKDEDNEVRNFINEHNQEMKITFDQLKFSNYSEVLEVLLLGVKDKSMPDQNGDNKLYTVRGLLAKHLWAKETNSSFAQTQREKDKEIVKLRIEACKKLIHHYEQQLAHLNNTTEQAKIALAKTEIAKRKIILEDYVASAQAYYNWLVKIIEDNNNQVKSTKSLSYTAIAQPRPIDHLQAPPEILMGDLQNIDKILANIGNPNGQSLVLPSQLKSDQMMVVKAHFADSVFAISTTGVHMLQMSKSNSMFNVFSILDKSQEQLEWDTLQAMYAYVRDCQGEVPIPIYGNDERTVAALYAAALAMGKEVKVLYGCTIPAKGSKEDQQLQQTVANMKIKLSHLGALENNQFESDPAVVRTQFVPPAA